MKTLLLSTIVATLFSGLAGCNQCCPPDAGHGKGKDSMAMSAEKTSAKMYTCSMHPEVVTKAPGKCPKCGMDLIEKK